MAATTLALTAPARKAARSVVVAPAGFGKFHLPRGPAVADLQRRHLRCGAVPRVAGPVRGVLVSAAPPHEFGDGRQATPPQRRRPWRIPRWHRSAWCGKRTGTRYRTCVRLCADTMGPATPGHRRVAGCPRRSARSTTRAPPRRGHDRPPRNIPPRDIGEDVRARIQREERHAENAQYDRHRQAAFKGRLRPAPKHRDHAEQSGGPVTCPEGNEWAYRTSEPSCRAARVSESARSPP